MKSRRSFLEKCALGVSGALFSNSMVAQPQSSNISEIQDLPSLENRKVLFIYGGWEGHEPEKFRDYLVPWMKSEGAEVSVFDNLDPYLDEKLMNTIDLVIQIHTMSEISEEQEAGLLKAVKNL